MFKTVYLVRGISGSGKTTLAKALSKELMIPYVEADMFHIVDGIYSFVPERIHDAHTWCRLHAEKLLRSGSGVIVSNTLTTLSELRVYFQLAAAYNAVVDVREPSTPWNKDLGVCVARNEHNVPQAALEKQFNRWFDIPTGIYEAKEFLERYK